MITPQRDDGASATLAPAASASVGATASDPTLVPETPAKPALATRFGPAAMRRRLGERQHRDATCLLINNVLGAGAGVGFWFLFARVAGLPPAALGVGYAIVAVATLIAVLAKGGLDMAILRVVPRAAPHDQVRLLRLALVAGSIIALGLAAMLGLGPVRGAPWTTITPAAWLLVTAIAVLLVVSWLLDAYALARSEAERSVWRNVVLAAARIILPLPVVALGFVSPVAFAWMLGLAVAVAAVAWRPRRARVLSAAPLEPPTQHDALAWDDARSLMLRSAWHNAAGSAAEFLPGLLLVPMVLALQGPEDAAYFGIAWTASSLLFLACAAIARSALAQLSRQGGAAERTVMRVAWLQVAWLVLPACLLVGAGAPILLSVFGSAYATHGAATLAILCAAVLTAAPWLLYLALVRSRGHVVPLVVLPLALVGGLVLMVPPFARQEGLEGIAVAWLACNLLVGGFATWRLTQLAPRRQEVSHGPVVRGGPHAE